MAEEHAPGDLPPELARLRQLDFEEHVRAAMAQGLSEAEARAHARSEMDGHDAPGLPRRKR